MHSQERKTGEQAEEWVRDKARLLCQLCSRQAYPVGLSESCGRGAYASALGYHVLGGVPMIE